MLHRTRTGADLDSLLLQCSMPDIASLCSRCRVVVHVAQIGRWVVNRWPGARLPALGAEGNQVLTCS